MQHFAKFPHTLLASFAILLGLTAGCATQQPSATPPLIQEAVQANIASFDHVWTTIRDKNWDTDLNGLDWEGIRDDFRPQVETAASTDEARARINSMLGLLDQSHMGVIPASTYDSVMILLNSKVS